MLRAGAVMQRKLRVIYHVLRQRQHLTREMAVRALADVLLISGALLAAFSFRSVRWIWAGVVAPSRDTLPSLARSYLGMTCLSILAHISVFYASGVYTYTRGYRDRNKVLVLMGSVGVGHLIFAIGLLSKWGASAFPWDILFASWLMTTFFVAGARLLFSLWWRFMEAESHYLPTSSDRMQVRTVLITGGAGYIGSALAGRLLELGYHVRVLDLLLYGDESLAEVRGHPRFELARGDLRHVDAVVSAMNGVDAVVHLGAIVGDAACQLSEDLTVAVNLQATRTIAEVSRGFGVKRFIFASTCSVYGASDEILDERSSLNPLSLYAHTKLASESALMSLADGAFSPTILRFGTIYGLSGRPRFDLVVNLLSAKAIQDGEVGIFGGSQWRPLVHVRDVAQAIVLVLQAPLQTVCGQIFNVGSNEQNYQIADLGVIIQRLVPSARVVTVAKEDDRNYRVCFDRIRDVLGFRPRYTVEDGVMEIIQDFARGKIVDYRDPRYNNYAFLKQHTEIQRALLEDDRIPDWSCSTTLTISPSRQVGC